MGADRDTPATIPVGMMAVVVGPSGAGKDTLMACAARHFDGRDDVMFVQRIITRETDAGGEAHRGVSVEDFEQMRQAGDLAVWWEAHGLHYGIPATAREKIMDGGLVIANGSRSALKHFKAAFGHILVINVTARPEVLAERLEARGRESREDILRRLERSSLGVQGDFKVITIDNSDALEDASQAMISALEDALHPLASA